MSSIYPLDPQHSHAPRESASGALRASGAFLSLLILILSGCTGEVALVSVDEVTPGEAAGFNLISYVYRSGLDPLTNETLQIRSDGSTGYRKDVDGVVSTQPRGYLSERDLFELRTGFARSDFFVWADSTYGETGTEAQSIDYDIGGQSATLVRHDREPVPASILPLIDQLEELMDRSRDFDRGTEVAVTQILQGSETRIQSREFAVVRSEATLLDLLWRIGSHETVVLPRVDFARQMVVGVFLGDENDSTAVIDIDPVARMDGDRVRVLFRRIDSSPRCIDPDLRPYALAVIPRVILPVDFFEDEDRIFRDCELGADPARTIRTP